MLPLQAGLGRMSEPIQKNSIFNFFARRVCRVWIGEGVEKRSYSDRIDEE